MTHYRNGKRSEYLVRDLLTTHGWECIAQTGGSRGPADLIVAHPDHGMALVQVGRASKRLGPADRERFLHAADLCSALALLAVHIPREGVSFFLVSRGLPRTWARWEPTTTQETPA